MTGKEAVKIALLQMTSGIDPAVNCAAIIAAMKEASAEGAVMLFTPEMALMLDRDGARAAGHIEPESGSLWVKQLAEAARTYGIWLHIGSAAFASENSSTEAKSKKVNRALVIDDQGVIRARYDKIHLFDVDLPTGESWRESASFAGGTEAVAVDTPWFRLGLSVCYDLRFPDLYRALTDEGAEVLAIPAAFTVPTGIAHWHILQRARAIEAGVYVISAAQGGTHEDGRATYGHSLIIDPWGEVLLDMANRPGLGFATIDPARINDVRSRLPALRHRRPIGTVSVR